MFATPLLVQDEPLVLLRHRDELVDRPELDDSHDLAHVDRVDVEHAAAKTARDRGVFAGLSRPALGESDESEQEERDREPDGPDRAERRHPR